jgi:hypothetical protein
VLRRLKQPFLAKVQAAEINWIFPFRRRTRSGRPSQSDWTFASAQERWFEWIWQIAERKTTSENSANRTQIIITRCPKTRFFSLRFGFLRIGNISQERKSIFVNGPDFLGSLTMAHATENGFWEPSDFVKTFRNPSSSRRRESCSQLYLSRTRVAGRKSTAPHRIYRWTRRKSWTQPTFCNFRRDVKCTPFSCKAISFWETWIHFLHFVRSLVSKILKLQSDFPLNTLWEDNRWNLRLSIRIDGNLWSNNDHDSEKEIRNSCLFLQCWGLRLLILEPRTWYQKSPHSPENVKCKRE